MSSPAWSPDGNKVVFSGLSVAGPSDLYVIDMFGLVSPEIVPLLRAGGWTEVIRKTEFDYAFLRIESNPLPAEQDFRTVWTSEDDAYALVVRGDAP